MRLIRIGQPGKERPGLLQADGIVDLRVHFSDIPDINADFFDQGWLKRLSRVQLPGENISMRFGAPIARPSKIICLGKNYSEHAKEGGFDAPAAPLLFCKTLNTLNGPFDPVQMPVSSGQIDWEVELAVIIGRRAKRLSSAEAPDYVAGFTVMNDVSARQAQFAGSQWFRGKSFDTFAPMGPCLVTPDEIANLKNLRLTTRVNGTIMQDGNTRDMIFDIPFILEDISRDITLEPGDVIATGTPAGVGIFRDPPVVLSAGDEVTCEIEGIGAIRNCFISST
jgi:2-keto-4-pentenoate hydratase/2-oxohepta-3-ene-1,7-dioic acid hydratase in catechol pathway